MAGEKSNGRETTAEKTWQRDALPRGTLLQGYRVDQIIGRGGFGITYRVVDALDQVFAVKECFPRQFVCRDGLLVQPVGSDDEGPFQDCLTRFLREAKALVRLTANSTASEGIVRVVTLFESNKTAYLVMEHLSGQTLLELINAHPGGIPADRLGPLMDGMLGALSTVHAAGLLHRDIKPANVFLRAGGGPTLIDFGAARAVRGGQTTTFTQIFSESYAPIEQILGEPQDPSADLYALGATFYRAIGGTLVDAVTRHKSVLASTPDPLPPAGEIGRGRYPAELLTAIDACLRPKAEQRPQSVAALRAMILPPEGTTMLAPATSHETMTTVLAPPPPSVPGPSRPVPDRQAADRPTSYAPPRTKSRPGRTAAASGRPRRRIGPAAIVAAMVMLLLTSVGAGAWYVHHRQVQREEQRAAGEAARVQAETERRVLEEEAARQADLQRQQADALQRQQAAEAEAAAQQQQQRLKAETETQQRLKAEAESEAAARKARARAEAARSHAESPRVVRSSSTTSGSTVPFGSGVMPQIIEMATPKGGGNTLAGPGGGARCHLLAEKLSLGAALNAEDRLYQRTHCP
ncbi:MAG: hypothetical protein RLZZ501_1168 [Pseudomonadota bacterium]|jgi:serine/threonine protein kinase